MVARLYNETYDMPSGHMFPLYAETGGRLNAEFTGYVTSVIVAGLADRRYVDARVEFELSSRCRFALAPLDLPSCRVLTACGLLPSTRW